MQGNTSPQQGGQGSSNTNNRPAGLSWSQPQLPKTAPAPASAASTPSSAKPISASANPAKKSVSNNQSSGTGKLIALFVAGVVVGAIAIWGWTQMGDQAPATVTTNTNNTGTTGTTNTIPTGTTGSTNTNTGTSATTAAGGTQAFSVASQPAGLAVAITSVSLTQPTWIVIYDSINGTRGNALGAALMFPETKVGNVALLRTTIAGKEYLIGRSVDNGDKKFSMQDDKPVLNAAGAPIYTTFRAQ